MNCDDIRETLSEGRTPSGAGLRKHLAECELCRELLADGGGLAQALASYRADEQAQIDWTLPEAKHRIEREKGFIPSLRARSTKERRLLALAALSLAVVLSLLLSRQRAWQTHSRLDLLTASGVLLGAAWLSLRTGLRALPEPRRELRAMLIGVGCLALPFLLAVGRPGVAAWGISSPPWTMQAVTCFGFGAAWSLPLLILLELLERQQSPNLSSLLPLAAACGISANLVLTLHCSDTDRAHVLFGHATLGVVWLCVLFVVRRLRAKRAASSSPHRA